MRRALRAIETQQAASHTYQVMTAVAYYAGLRPSEVVILRASSHRLPNSSWGPIDVTEADVLNDEAGEPKTGARSVPIPPVLVADLASCSSGPAPDGCRHCRTGFAPGTERAAKIDHTPLRIYDCRHAAATTWLKAGVPLGESARPQRRDSRVDLRRSARRLRGDRQLPHRRSACRALTGLRWPDVRRSDSRSGCRIHPAGFDPRIDVEADKLAKFAERDATLLDQPSNESGLTHIRSATWFTSSRARVVRSGC